MSNTDQPANFIRHYGVKGMKWGVRRDRSASAGPSPVSVTTKTTRKGRVKVGATGGTRQPAHEDAIAAVKVRRQAKGSGTASLSNKELQAAVQRMNLEQQYGRLVAQQPGLLNAGKRQVNEILGYGKTYNDVLAFANSPGGKLIKSELSKPSKPSKLDTLLEPYGSKKK